VSEQGLDDAGIGAAFQEVSGEAVAERMRGDTFAEAAAGPGIAAGGLHGAGGEMEVRPPGGEEPRTGGTVNAKVGTENFQEARREHGVTVFASLAVIDADEHALAIDAGELEGDGFGDAEAGSVAGEEDGAVFAAGDVVEELLDFVGGEDDGEFVVEAGAREVLLFPGHFEGDQEEELDGGDEAIDGLRRELALFSEVKEILTDGVEVEIGGTAGEIFGEGGDIMNVAALGGEGEVANAQIVGHALA